MEGTPSTLAASWGKIRGALAILISWVTDVYGMEIYKQQWTRQHRHGSKHTGLLTPTVTSTLCACQHVLQLQHEIVKMATFLGNSKLQTHRSILFIHKSIRPIYYSLGRLPWQRVPENRGKGEWVKWELDLKLLFDKIHNWWNIVKRCLFC